MVRVARKTKNNPLLKVDDKTPHEVSEVRVQSMRGKGNKIAKSELYHKLRGEKMRAQKARRLQYKKDIKKYGAENVAPHIVKSIDAARENDPTMGVVTDACGDEVLDEFAEYFRKIREPKILLTTCMGPCRKVKLFVKELKWLFPNCKYYTRRQYPLREVTAHAISAEYTHMISINQSHGHVCGLIISHLPNGPTARFRVSNLKLYSEIDGVGERTEHYPELFLKNFETTIGARISRLLTSLYPTTRDYHGRAIVTFCNKRDFIFVRAHRYIFHGMEDVGMQELGPRFTLRLRELYAGTFAECDPRTGSGMDAEWTSTREKSRREFAL